jgi:hypothetical protein
VRLLRHADHRLRHLRGRPSEVSSPVRRAGYRASTRYPHSRQTDPSGHASLVYSNTCSKKTRRSGTAPFLSATGLTTPRRSAGLIINSNCSNDRLNGSVLGDESQQSASSRGATRKPLTEASAQPMHFSETRARSYGRSDPSMAQRVPAGSTAARTLAWREVSAQGTPPNTMVGGPWLLSSSQRLDAIFPIAPNDILPSATARVIGVN